MPKLRYVLFVLIALTGCKPSSTPPSDAAPPPVRSIHAESVRRDMQKHFDGVIDIQRAIVRGELAIARDRARWLATHDDPSMPPAWQGRIDALRATAERLSQSTDLPSAANLAADLAGQCGQCHRALEANLSFAWTAQPPVTPRFDDLMRRHEWAAERLWEGIIGPNDERWQDGIDLLASLPLDADGYFGHLPNAHAILAAATQVRTLASNADRTRRRERAEWYGDLLNGCVGCHQHTIAVRQAAK